MKRFLSRQQSVLKMSNVSHVRFNISVVAQTRFVLSEISDKTVKKATQTRKFMSVFSDKNIMSGKKKDITHTL